MGNEDGREQQNRVFAVIDRLEVVLLDIDGVHGAGLVASAAIHTAVGVELGMPVLHVDGSSGTHARAVGASDAEIIFEFEGVMEILYVSHWELV